MHIHSHNSFFVRILPNEGMAQQTLTHHLGAENGAESRRKKMIAEDSMTLQLTLVRIPLV